MIYSRIAGTGSFLPERIITNAEMEKLVETSDDWIASRTGIRQRHMALEEEFECEIPDEEAEKITTVQQAVDYINSHLKK